MEKGNIMSSRDHVYLFFDTSPADNHRDRMIFNDRKVCMGRKIRIEGKSLRWSGQINIRNEGLIGRWLNLGKKVDICQVNVSCLYTMKI